MTGNTWFIRLGHAPELAKKHGIVMIGYDIDENLTGYDRNQIKAYFEEKFPSNKRRVYGQYIGQVDTFMNYIKVGDTIVSPFKGGHKIGEVKKESNTIGVFFEEDKKELQNIITYYKERDEYIEFKPAIQVDWQEEINLDDSPKLKAELSKTMRQTIYRLEHEEDVIIERDTENNFFQKAMANIGRPIIDTINNIGLINISININYNTINMNDYSVSGNNNSGGGNDNSVSGNNNFGGGNNNSVVGNNNSVSGDNNSVSGNDNSKEKNKKVDNEIFSGFLATVTGASSALATAFFNLFSSQEVGMAISYIFLYDGIDNFDFIIIIPLIAAIIGIGIGGVVFAILLKLLYSTDKEKE